MRGLSFTSLFVVLFAALSSGCLDSQDSAGEEVAAPTGSLALTLELRGRADINDVEYSITRGDNVEQGGTIDTSAPRATASVEVYGLLPGDGYVVTMNATSIDGSVTCSGSTPFSVEVAEATDVMVFLRCKPGPHLGGVRVNGKFNFCAALSKVVVSPLQTSVGSDIQLAVAASDYEDDPVELIWTSTGGSIDDPHASNTQFTCTEGGSYTIVASASDHPGCMDSWSVSVTCVDSDSECQTDADCLGVFPLPTCRVDTKCTAGVCVRGEPLEVGTPCLRGGTCIEGGYCSYGSCMTDSDCEIFFDPAECLEGPTCVQDPIDLDFSYCQPGDALAAGTPCSAESCDGFGECVGPNNRVQSKVVRVACQNNVSVDPSYLLPVLTVKPPSVWKDDTTETDVWTISGEAVFDKEFLDAAQAVILGGVSTTTLVDLNWTVQVRSGATMDDVELGPVVPYSCELDRNRLCDPLNDLSEGGNSDCTPTGGFNKCARFVAIPTSTDCDPGGLCRSSGAAPTAQCEANGFCISDQLRVPLEEKQVEVTPLASNSHVTFGWHETPNRGFNPDGSYVLPVAVYSQPVGPIGFRSDVGALSTALECMLGGDAGRSNLGPYPVPDQLLLQYLVP